MDNIFFNILGLAFVGVIAFSGVQSVGDHLETQVNEVSHCIDQAGSKYTTC